MTTIQQYAATVNACLDASYISVEFNERADTYTVREHRRGEVLPVKVRVVGPTEVYAQVYKMYMDSQYSTAARFHGVA